MDWHRYSGYAVLGLLVFRLYWGCVGSSTARFAEFVKSPAVTIAYLRLRHSDRSAAAPGHNPLGAWSVIALLMLLIAQVVLGLFAVDIDGIESGPLASYVSFDVGRLFAKRHEDVFDILLIFIALHVLAVAYYLIVRRRNLIAAMIHGRATFPVTDGMRAAPGWRVAVGIAVALLIVFAVSNA